MVKNGCCEYIKVQEDCYLEKQKQTKKTRNPTTKLLRETGRMIKISRKMQKQRLQEEEEAFTKTAVSICQGYTGK